jgi:hypothetical protein
MIVQRTIDVRGDFEQRFAIFKRTYDRASSREEKNQIVREFLERCTAGEITLVRSVIGELLHLR